MVTLLYANLLDANQPDLAGLSQLLWRCQWKARLYSFERMAGENRCGKAVAPMREHTGGNHDDASASLDSCRISCGAPTNRLRRRQRPDHDAKQVSSGDDHLPLRGGNSGKVGPRMAQLDHAAAAKKGGLKLLPRTVIVFGNPRLGTANMEKGRLSPSTSESARVARRSRQGLADIQLGRIPTKLCLRCHPAQKRRKALTRS